MAYPKLPNFRRLAQELELASQLKHEYGAAGIAPVLAEAERAMRIALRKANRLPIDKRLARDEPNTLAKIRDLRPKGPRTLWDEFDRDTYREKLEGALLARMAGCTLGAGVEFWAIEKMQSWARHIGQPFPPTDYWKALPEPYVLRYGASRRDAYTRGGMDGVPVDDDIAYTLLGLLILEEYGPDFSIEDAGKTWVKYLPLACTAEKVALDNLREGVPASKAAEKNNPYCQWIGADIRSDPWGYSAPGMPELAAEMAYRDSYLSHRRNGIYGAMYFAAAIASAFAVEHPVRALELALTEIPKRCALARAVRWALKAAPKIADFAQAREAMEEKFRGMHPVHTINNACLTIWGLSIGGTDVTKVLSETVAMGMDNDCNAATAGSIVGAAVGAKGIPKHWHKNFNNTVHSYLIRRKKFTITGLVKRFTRQAERVFKDAGD